jgi:hypothetical protein
LTIRFGRISEANISLDSVMSNIPPVTYFIMWSNVNSSPELLFHVLPTPLSTLSIH